MILEKFLRNFRSRIASRANYSYPEEMVLLDAFKYYDTYNEEKCTLRLFLKVTKIKFGMNMLNDDELEKIFDYYVKMIGNRKQFNYREFIAISLDVRNIHAHQMFKQAKPKPLVKNKEEIISEEKIGNLIQFIKQRLKKESMRSFLKLFIELQYRSPIKTPKAIQKSLKKCSIDFKIEDYDLILNFFTENESGFDLDKFYQILVLNYSNDRKSMVVEMFDKLDYKNKKKIEIDILPKLFIPKNYFKVKQGVLSLEQAMGQINDFIETFIEFKQTNSIEQRDVVFMFSFLSPYMENTQTFKDFINFCFRYNDLKRHMKFLKETKICSKMKISQQEVENEFELVKGKIIEKLNSYGNTGYINLMCRFIDNDIDIDRYLNFREFQRSIEECNLDCRPREIEQVFKEYAGKTHKMNFDIFLEDIVPKFENHRVKKINQLYDNLNPKREVDIDFLAILNSFSAKNHPDYQSQLKSEYEIKNDFFPSFRNFLKYYQTFYLKVTKEALLRFFEYFGRNWEEFYFDEIISKVFKVNNDKFHNNHHQNIINTAPWNINRSTNSSKLYQQFKEKSNIEMKSRNFNDGKSISNKSSHMSRLKMKQELKSDISSKRSRIKSKRSQKSQIERSYYSSKNQSKSIKSEISKKRKNEQNGQYQNEVAGINRLRGVFKDLKDISLILEYEYALTKISDSRGYLDFQGFLDVSRNFKFLDKISDEEIKNIYEDFREETYQLHIQTFINYLRDQMNEDQENTTIKLYDRLCSRYYSEVIKLEHFKKSFIPKNFTFSQKSINETREMFFYALDLFDCLNLQVKGREWMDLDDFLYFFDNLTFYIKDDKHYTQILRDCFR